jgi:pantothenate kinase
MAPSRYHRFTRDEWARLRADTALSLTEHDLARLRGLNDRVSLEVGDIRRWYIERFFALRKTAFQDPSSYFHRYAELTDDDAETVAASIWHDINEPNLLENILPTRERAHLILEKAPDHSVKNVRLQKR